MTGTPDLVLEKSEKVSAESFSDRLHWFVGRGARLALRNPASLLWIMRLMRGQDACRRARDAWEAQGVHVPPVLILSLTSRCNLSCAVCYSRRLHKDDGRELDAKTLQDLIGQAQGLGVSAVLLAGGEPLLRPELFDIPKKYSDMVFPVFTNGTLIDDAMADRFARCRNTVPVISIEGGTPETDGRRGAGVHAAATRAMAALSARKVFWGVSVTVTTRNASLVTSREYVQSLIRSGCRIFFFVEYVPTQEGTDDMVVTVEQRREMAGFLADYKRELPALFVSFPGDEEMFGGCLASGRGFLHISAAGDVQPCPFAPVSDANITETSLRGALRSPLLEAIRDREGLARETAGGCALWRNRDALREIEDEVQERREAA